MKHILFLICLTVALSSNAQSIWRNATLANMTVVTPVTAPASPVPDILWYKFNEGSGTSVADDVGSNDLLATNVTWAAGKAGNAIKKGAVAGYAGSTSGNITYNTNDVTVTVWLKIAGYDDGTVFAGQRSSAVPAAFNFAFSYGIPAANIDGNWVQSINSLNPNAAPLEAPMADWVHFAFTFHRDSSGGSDEIKALLNGTSWDSTVTAADTGDGSFETHLMYFLNTGASEVLMDDFRVYSGILTSNQIYQVYADPK